MQIKKLDEKCGSDKLRNSLLRKSFFIERRHLPKIMIPCKHAEP